jgi:hypothetical protein
VTTIFTTTPITTIFETITTTDTVPVTTTTTITSATRTAGQGRTFFTTFTSTITTIGITTVTTTIPITTIFTTTPVITETTTETTETTTTLTTETTTTLTTETTTTTATISEGKITGGGQISRDTNFGFNVQSDGASIKGVLEYIDKGSKINLHSVQMTSLTINADKTKGTLSGTATVNGVEGFTFIVEVEDNSEPGRNDKFKITIPELGYTKDGSLLRGNIQIHK